MVQSSRQDAAVCGSVPVLIKSVENEHANSFDNSPLPLVFAHLTGLSTKTNKHMCNKSDYNTAIFLARWLDGTNECYGNILKITMLETPAGW